MSPGPNWLASVTNEEFSSAVVRRPRTSPGIGRYQIGEGEGVPVVANPYARLGTFPQIRGAGLDSSPTSAPQLHCPRHCSVRKSPGCQQRCDSGPVNSLPRSLRAAARTVHEDAERGRLLLR
jgi:hypothetical protein